MPVPTGAGAGAGASHRRPVLGVLRVEQGRVDVSDVGGEGEALQPPRAACRGGWGGWC